MFEERGGERVGEERDLLSEGLGTGSGVMKGLEAKVFKRGRFET